MWLELCTNNEEDWVEALRICGQAFASTTWFTSPTVDRNTSLAFTEEYFRYIYETELSGGRAGLVCLKTIDEDNTISIVYVCCCSYERQPPTEGDKSAMERACKELMDDNLEGDLWGEVAIHDTIRSSAETLNFCHMFGVFHAVAPDFAGRGIGRKHYALCIDMLYVDGVKRGLLDKMKSCVHYAIIDEIRVMKIQAIIQQKTIAHLHEPPGIDCPYDCSDIIGNERHNCCFVTARELGKSNGLLEKLAAIFNQKGISRSGEGVK